MTPINIQESNFVVTEGTTIKDAMAAITDNHRGAVAIVSEAGNLVGVVSDGDIRRALVKNVSLHSSVSDIANLNPVTILDEPDYQKKCVGIFQDNVAVHMLPVVDGNNKLVDIVVRNSESK